MRQSNRCRTSFGLFSSVALASLTASLIGGCDSHRASPTREPAGGTGAAVGPAVRARGASLFGTDVIGLPTGASITPDAAPGSRLLELDPHIPGAPDMRAGGAVASALSPDGRTLLVLTSGYNRTYDAAGSTRLDASSEYVFVYDVSGGEARETQVVTVPNAFGGIACHPAGDRFYVGGGNDDVVHTFARAADPGARWVAVDSPMALGHLDAMGRGGLGFDQTPYAAGVAVSASGARLAVANHENDSLTVIDLAARAVLGDVTLGPGGGAAGGEFPSGVAIVGESRAYVTCQRDREVVEVDLDARRVVRRIRVGGQPTKIIADRAGARLFVANANSDTVSILDRARGVVIAEIATSAPPGVPTGVESLRGSNPNALALSPDESRLYVTNGGNNALAVIDLAGKRVTGLIPTGFYPTAVAVARDGAHLYVTHAKSPSGPNVLGPFSNRERAQTKPYAPGRGNQFALQLVHSGLLSLPTPAADVLQKLTAQSILNNRFDHAPSVPPVFEALRGKVKHVIYVVGENRTYDQIFGDLPGTDGDPRLVHWGEAITPNHHALARTFVAMDRFFDAGGVSGEGWQWSTSGRTTDVAEKGIPIEYANRGKHSYDWEGCNRSVNVSWPTVAERLAWNPKGSTSIDLLPGIADVGAVDGPDEGGRGFLWDAALAAGLTVRNYGAFCDESRYGLPKDDPAYIPPLGMPFASKTRVSFPTRKSLHDVTDPYFRCFDMNFSDFWRFKEWERELDESVAKGSLPSLEIVRMPHDHLGSFETAADGVNTPDTQIAGGDYALGLMVEKLSRTPFWKDTILVRIEDDAQNGSDHVDAHRSYAIFAGGHARRGAVVSTAYATPSVLRTIELLLGLPPLGQQDAFAPPMADVLDAHLDETPYTARVPDVLRSTTLPLPPPKPSDKSATPRGDAATWATMMRGQDFSRPDALDPARFNRALECGLLNAPGCASEAPELASCATRDGDEDDADDDD
jgi:YVTN family beta-propeller protein